MATGQKLSGLNPLAYMGVEPSAPPQVRIETRQPTVNDYSEYNIGTWWLMVVEQEVWILISKLGGVATWIQLYPGGGGGGGADAFPADVGTANEVGGEVNVFGGLNINTTGSGNTLTVILDDDVTLSGFLRADNITATGGDIHTVLGNIYTLNGGDITADGTVTAGTGLVVLSGGIDSTGTTRLRDLSTGVMQTNSSGTVFSDKGTNGQLLIGSTAGAPDWANITSSGGTITVTEGANSIDLAVTGGPGGPNVSFQAILTATDKFSYGPFDPPLFVYIGMGRAWTVIFDNGGYFFPGDGAGGEAFFTAPADGQYEFTFTTIVNATSGQVAFIVPMIFGPGILGDTNNQFYICRSAASSSLAAEGQGTTTLDLDMNDEVRFGTYVVSATGSTNFIQYRGGTLTLPTALGNYSVQESWVSGKLID